MGLALAFKAFYKAWKEPAKATKFIQDDSKHLEPKLLEESVKEDPSHLRLLALLQQQGRLIDFLKEDISGFTDDQIGCAVRQIHADCAKTIEEFVTIRSLRDENEGSVIQVEKGYDPSQIKVVGKVSGEPPFSGILIHKGWKAHKKSLPKKIGKQMNEVIYPAEVEIR